MRIWPVWNNETNWRSKISLDFPFFIRRGEVTEYLEAEEAERKMLEEIRHTCVPHRC